MHRAQDRTDIRRGAKCGMTSLEERDAPRAEKTGPVFLPASTPASPSVVAQFELPTEAELGTRTRLG